MAKPKKIRQTQTADEMFESVAQELRNDSAITRSKMFGSEGLKVGNKVFGMLFKGKLVVKLPEQRVKALVASGDGEYFDPGHGRLMREWIAVRPRDKSQWLNLAEEAKSFVATKR